MAEQQNLKLSNTATLTAYVVLHAAFAAWVLLDTPISWGQVESIATAKWAEAGAGALVAALLVTLLNRLGDKLKAILVFWRLRNPLPGSRAFTELVSADPRIDVERLKQRLGGEFPTEPSEQNLVWYRTYKKHGDTPAVNSAQREYLLLRDMAWLSCVSGLVCTLLLLISGHVRAGFLFLTVDGMLYIAARSVATIAAERFVLTVLALESASEASATSKATGQ